MALLTLTQSHCRTDGLAALWSRLDAGWAALVSGSGWTADKQTYGVRGYVRITEVVHSPVMGWHPHFHVILLLDRELDQPRLNGLRASIANRFAHGVARSGGHAAVDRQHLEPMTPGTDGPLCAAFASPRSAVDAAVAAQRALELPVRMGLATGEAELRGADYFGAVLNRAARVMAAGHGGQILLVESTAGLLTGVDLVDLGPRRLRDVPMPVGVFQVQAAGLRRDFPPLRALDTNPGNLRPATTSLIGRESEVAEIEAAVRAHRLVTLTGVGGVGKTRLAVEVAGRLADEFPDGVWFFELAAVTDPAAIPDAVATGSQRPPELTASRRSELVPESLDKADQPCVM